MTHKKALWIIVLMLLVPTVFGADVDVASSSNGGSATCDVETGGNPCSENIDDIYTFGWDGGETNTWAEINFNKNYTISNVTITEHCMRANTVPYNISCWDSSSATWGETVQYTENNTNCDVGDKVVVHISCVTDRIRFYSENEGSGNQLYIQEIDIYNTSGASEPPVITYGSEIQEKTSIYEQTTPLTISSNFFQTLFSGFIFLNTSTGLYASATIPITNPSTSNSLECRILIDGSAYDSTVQRTMTAGQSANVITSTTNISQTQGNKSVSLQCRRESSPLSFDVIGSSVTIHELSSVQNKNINYAYFSSTAQRNESVNILTTENNTQPQFKRILITEFEQSIDYSDTGIITTDIYTGNEFCTNITRYGTSGSIGTVGGQCITIVENSTNYNISMSLYGVSGTATGKYHTKEMILHNDEYEVFNLTGVAITESYTKVANFSLFIDAGHTNSNIFIRSGFSFDSDLNNGVTGSFQIRTTNKNSSIVNRTVSVNQSGAVLLQTLVESATTGENLIELYASCMGQNCTFDSGNFIAYVSSGGETVQKEMMVYAHDYYTNLPINEFSIKDGFDNIYSTTTGVIILSPDGDFINMTAPANNDTEINYFENFTLNHNTSEILNVTLVRWTKVSAHTADGSPITNFTIGYHKINFSDGGSVTTNNGIAYVPLYNWTWNLEINTTQYARQYVNITATPYFDSYNYSLFTTNSFNFSFYDEQTLELINDREISIQLIGDYASYNISTTSGFKYIDLITPSEYLIRFNAVDYAERNYWYNLLNGTFNNLDLYMIEENLTTDVTAIVIDENNDRVEGAYIKVMRYDINTNSYSTREIYKTNFEGENQLNIILDDEFYQFIVEYPFGTIKKTTLPTYIYDTTLEFQILLGEEVGTRFYNSQDIDYSITFNNLTNAFSFTYSDPNNLMSEGCLNIYRVSSTKREVVNSSCSQSASGTIVLKVANITGATYEAKGLVGFSPTDYLLGALTYTFLRKDTIGNSGLFLTIIITLVMVFTAVWSVPLAMILTPLPLLFSSFAGVVTIPKIATVSLTVLSLIIAYIVGRR